MTASKSEKKPAVKKTPAKKTTKSVEKKPKLSLRLPKP